MAMLDEWGEEIKNIQDEGVFSQSSLGDFQAVDSKPGFPNTMPPKFPYAPTPTKTVHQVSENRYGLYQGAGQSVHAAYPGNSIHAAMAQAMGMGCVCPPAGVRSATAGMGTLLDDVLGPQTAGGGWTFSETGNSWTAPIGLDEMNAGGKGGSSGWSSMSTQDQIGVVTDAVNGAADLAMSIAGFATQQQRLSQESQLRMQAISQQLSQQQELFTARLAQLRSNPAQNSAQIQQIAQLQQQLAAATQRAGSTGNAADIAALQAALDRSRSVVGPRSPWPWIVGGIGVLGVGGLIVYLVTRKS